jgi:hypothetical protein
MPALPKRPAKEERYWAFEFPIALLLIAGSFVLSYGIPHIISRSTNWATMFIGAGESLIAVAVFYMARVNAVRVVSVAVFAAGAIAFYMGLNAIY